MANSWGNQLQLWSNYVTKLNKSKRKWEPLVEGEKGDPHEEVHLFCKKCGVNLGKFHVNWISLETYMYCERCVSKFKKEVPFEVFIQDADPDASYMVVEDSGSHITLRKTMYGCIHDEYKVCYFNSKGRSFKYRGKKYYL